MVEGSSGGVGTPPAPPLLEMSGIRKSFLGVPALVDASLRVAKGEVHALVGQNGAGKSTLIKVLTGVHRRDAGTVVFDGAETDFSSPQAAQLGGIATIYQEVNLVPYRSVAENICLGREPRRFGLIDRRAVHRRAEELLERLDQRVDVTRPLYEFPIATQQMTAIARALSFDARLVIMDEPTSSLADHEVEVLFGVIRRLRDQGVSVLFVSHRLDELYAVCDRVTIMRDGRTVDDRAMADVTRYELVSTMLGRELTPAERTGQHAGAPATDRDCVLQVDHLRRPPVLRDVSLRCGAGEVVALAGLLGSGRSETVRAIFGADPVDGGEIRLGGEAVRVATPRDAIRAGVAFTSEDRKADGIVPQMSVRENLTLALLPKLARHGVVDRKRQREIVDRYVDRIGIKTANPDQQMRELSGGNQQKVLLARWLCTDPRLLLLDEPTRGIDVGAKREIQSLIAELATQGLAVVLVSSELEEVVDGSDRVVVLRDGTSVSELTGAEIREDAILAAMAHGSATGADDGRAGDG